MGLFGYLPMPRKTGQCWVNVANEPRVDSSKSRKMRYVKTNVEAADLDSDIDFPSGSSPKISTWRFTPPPRSKCAGFGGRATPCKSPIENDGAKNS